MPGAEKLYLLAVALLIDLVAGDPKWLPHPVRLIGTAIEKGEAALRRIKPLPPRAAGIILWLLITGGVYGAVYFIEKAVKGSLLGDAVIILLLSSTIALRGLAGEGRKTIGLVSEGKLDEARAGLKSLVGRDTEGLDAPGILRAATESLAENASDGVIAPVFYYILGGLPLAFAYKAANTLDSMTGYKNERYIEFGWASARLDDLANLIPARLTGLFIAAGAVLLRLKGKRSFMTMLRDGGKHPSPNSGIPMAAMAGALGASLGGPALYGGKLIDKPFIGKEGDPVTIASARAALRLTFVSCLLGSLAIGLIGGLI